MAPPNMKIILIQYPLNSIPRAEPQLTSKLLMIV
jgi:hypothetical protein